MSDDIPNSVEDDDEKGREEASFLGTADLNERPWRRPRIVVSNGPVTIVEMRKGRLWRPRGGGDAV